MEGEIGKLRKKSCEVWRIDIGESKVFLIEFPNGEGEKGEMGKHNL